MFGVDVFRIQNENKKAAKKKKGYRTAKFLNPNQFSLFPMIPQQIVYNQQQPNSFPNFTPHPIPDSINNQQIQNYENPNNAEICDQNIEIDKTKFDLDFVSQNNTERIYDGDNIPSELEILFSHVPKTCFDIIRRGNLPSIRVRNGAIEVV